MDLSSLSEEQTGDAFGLYPHPLPDWIHVDCLGHAGTRQTLSTIQFDVNQVLGPYLGSSLGVAVLTTPGKRPRGGVVLRHEFCSDNHSFGGEGNPGLRR